MDICSGLLDNRRSPLLPPTKPLQISVDPNMPSLPTRNLGKNGPVVSALGLGAMGESSGLMIPGMYPNLLRMVGMGAFYGHSDETESLDTLTYAANRGMTFWDTADLYGDSMLPLFQSIALSMTLNACIQAKKSSENGLHKPDDALRFSSRPSSARST